MPSPSSNDFPPESVPDQFGGIAVLRWTIELRPLTSCLAIACWSTLWSLIRLPLVKKAWSAGGTSRWPLSKPVQSLALPK